MADRLTRRVFSRVAAVAPFVALALVSDGSRPARAAYNCTLTNRSCVDRLTGAPVCSAGCRLFCAGRAATECAACAVCAPEDAA